MNNLRRARDSASVAKLLRRQVNVLVGVDETDWILQGRPDRARDPDHRWKRMPIGRRLCQWKARVRLDRNLAVEVWAFGAFIEQLAVCVKVKC